jgi:hypothetical protein
MDDTESRDANHARNDESLKPELKTEHEDHPYSTSEDTNQSKKKRGHPQSLWQRWRAGTIQNQLTVMFTALIFVATSIYAVFSYYQFATMKDGGKQTDRIIAADERLAKAMEDSVHAQKDSLIQTLAQNKRALDSTIAASRLDQRAWVGPIGMTMHPISTDKPITATVAIGNSGKTFALDVNSTVWIYASNTALTQLPHSREGLLISPMVLFPNQQITFTPNLPGHPTQIDVDALTSKKVFVYLYGDIAYSDVFGSRHRTEFCGIFDGAKNFNACTFHYQAD